MRTCDAPGCEAPATRYGRYCNTHKARQRRHGAADQRTITKAALEPYLRRVDALKRRNVGSPLWTLLEARWAELVDYLRDVQAPFLAGRPGHMPTYKAACELLRLAEEVPASAVLETVIAMHLLREEEPGRFKSDEAFKRQLVRRVRSLTEVAVGTWYDHRTGRVKRAYRDLSPRISEVTGNWLASFISGPALAVAKREQELKAKRERERVALAQALHDLE